MYIFVGDVHGSLEQFMFPLENRYRKESDVKNCINEMNEITLNELSLDGIERLTYMGDIFGGVFDCIIANTLARLVIEHENVEWILGNRDLVIFGKIYRPDIKNNSKHRRFKESCFNDGRFDNQLNKSLLREALQCGRIKVVSTFKNMLVSHAAITREGLNELRRVLELRDVRNVWSDTTEIPFDCKIDAYDFNTLDDLNYIFRQPSLLFFADLKIFKNKHVFMAIKESIIGHETFINEFQEAAIGRVRNSYGNWLTMEYTSMNAQCQLDRSQQFMLNTVHLPDGTPISTNIHHTDCNGQYNPCYFKYENDSWSCMCGREKYLYKYVDAYNLKWKFITDEIKYTKTIDRDFDHPRTMIVDFKM